METMRESSATQLPPRVPSSVLEGLFVRGLRAEGRLAEGLLSLGYDIRKPELDYPVVVWQRCVNYARQELYPHMSDEEAYRLLGRKLVGGFLETIVGRVVAVALPLIGPAHVVDRLPRYLTMMGRSDIQVTITPVGVRARRVVLMKDRYNRPEFIAGGMEVALEHASAQATITVEERNPDSYRLLMRW